MSCRAPLAVLAIVVSLLAVGCSPDDDPSSDPTATAGTTTPAPGETELSPAWSSPVGELPFQTVRPIDENSKNEGPNPIDAGERTIVLGRQQVLGLDTATGAVDWTAALDAPVCATAPRASADGTAVVLTSAGSDGTCTDVVALDIANGQVRWTAPVPRADRAVGHEVSVGADSVVVAAECAGFTIYSATDGAVRADVAGRTVGGRCASAAGDGTSVVLSSGPRLSVYDAATGQRTRSSEIEGIGRVGDVVSSDPLVVSAVVESQGRLVSLAADEPVVFGRESNTFGGVPQAAAMAGGVLWVQYADVPEMVGYDPASGEESTTVPIDPDTDALVGVHDERLVVTAGARVDDVARTQLDLIDPARPDEPQVLGLLPSPEDDDRGVSTSAVVGDLLVRIWVSGPGGRAEGIPLPSGGGSTGGDGSSDDPSQAA